MTESLEITPSGPVRGTIRPPGSKSITNRALVCAALASGTSHVAGLLDSDDTRVMVDSLGRLGIQLRGELATGALDVVGCGGKIPAPRASLYVGNSGTTMRFLSAVCALGHGTFRIDGNARMRERPLGDLAATLRDLGVAVRCESPGECPPVVIEATGLHGGSATIRGDISSQFLSGLLLAMPSAVGEVELVLGTPLVSQPYVRMTLALVDSFGGRIDATPDLSRFRSSGGGYRAMDYQVEPDASAASYFFAAAAVTGGRVTVEGLSAASLQGDVAFVDVLENMGCTVERGGQSITVMGGKLRGVDVDMNAISDTVQTLAAVAVFADGPTTIRNVGHIRHKETDRIGALATELRKLGAAVEDRHDGLRIEPRPLHAARINTYDDHRMAMSLALVGLNVPGVVINDPGCTAKTYPRYFDDLARLVSPSM